MLTLTIPDSGPLHVRWRCRKCGHDAGIARTAIPLSRSWSDDMIRALLISLRRKLVRKHFEGQGCYAVLDDFDIQPYVPEGKTLLDRV